MLCWPAIPPRAGLLILWSATHGIEGYCGSGCQTAYLHDDAFMRKLDETRTAVLFVHALNPYGFSYGRRVNEDNADLNRNFRDFSSPPPVNEAYAEIHALLLPSQWPPSAESEGRLGAWVAAHGERAYQAAVSGGQYAFPTASFTVARAHRGAIAHCVRCCATMRPDGARLELSISIRASVPADMARRSTTGVRSAPISNARATGGAPR